MMGTKPLWGVYGQKSPDATPDAVRWTQPAQAAMEQVRERAIERAVRWLREERVVAIQIWQFPDGAETASACEKRDSEAETEVKRRVQ